jgi:hypothetical protein
MVIAPKNELEFQRLPEHHQLQREGQHAKHPLEGHL